MAPPQLDETKLKEISIALRRKGGMDTLVKVVSLGGLLLTTRPRKACRPTMRPRPRPKLLLNLPSFWTLKFGVAVEVRPMPKPTGKELNPRSLRRTYRLHKRRHTAIHPARAC